MALNVFKGLEKPIIGMVHLDYLAGQKEYRGLAHVVAKAVRDISALQEGGIDALLMENWREYTTTPEADPVNVRSMLSVCEKVSEIIAVPFGINVLNNDYKASFEIANAAGAGFVQMDVFSDRVRSDFDFNPNAAAHPFTVEVDTADVMKHKPRNVDLMVSIQPKHYQMLEKKGMDLSAKEAYEGGADAVIVTGPKTGRRPDASMISLARSKVPKAFPVGVGSGVSEDNLAELLPAMDFAIVGTSLKVGLDVDREVDQARVKRLMALKRKLLAAD